MVIAVNIRILSGDFFAAGLLIDYFEQVAATNSEHRFYFISNEEITVTSALQNVKTIVIRQHSANPLLWKLWYNYKLPAILKKTGADVLVSADAVGSLRTRIPQCILVNDIQWLSRPEWYSRRYTGFIKTGLPAFIQKAQHIIAFSETVRNEIVKRFTAAENKITVSFYEADKKFQPLSKEEKDMLKEKYTEGNEYFFFYGAIHNRSNLTSLLKAFSLFKKRQKSSMQLVLLTDHIPEKNEFVASLRLYKYRNEIKLLSGTGDAEAAVLTAAAWCAVNLSPLLSDTCFLKNALQCDIPVIAADDLQAKEILGNAALYANPQSVTSISEQLMLIYKDESRYTELVSNGKKIKNTQTGASIWQQLNESLPYKN